MTAHKQGCAAISLEGLSNRDRPQLKVWDGVNAARIFLASLAFVVPPPLPSAAHLVSSPRGNLRSCCARMCAALCALCTNALSARGVRCMRMSLSP